MAPVRSASIGLGLIDMACDVGLTFGLVLHMESSTGKGVASV